MKIPRTKALILAAVLALAPAAGCKHDTASSKSQTQSVTNSVDAGALSENNEHYIYLDVKIKNPTSTEYELSTLNNFFLILNDGTELSSAVRTQLYAVSNFSDLYSGSPFTVPANGEFSGIIGGFTVPDGTNGFTVGFFPTRDDANNKTNLIKVEVKPSDIISLPDELKK